MNFKTKVKRMVFAILVLASAGTVAWPLPAGHPGLAGQGRAAGEPVPAAGSPVSYDIRKGDCLWSIARRFKVNVALLAVANNLDLDGTLPENEVLVIPTPAAGVRPGTGLAYRDISRYQFWPVRGAVSSGYGLREGGMHHGLDIAADEGRPIRALDGGKVVFAGERGIYGQTVIIDHGRGFRSLYAHASKLEVSPGEQVGQGRIIARVGSTGHSTGPHLHLELWFNGVPLNPVAYLSRDEQL